MLKAGNKKWITVEREITQEERNKIGAEQVQTLDKIAEKKRLAKLEAEKAKEEIKTLEGEEMGKRQILRSGKIPEHYQCEEWVDLGLGVSSWCDENGEERKRETIDPVRLRDLRQTSFAFAEEQREEERRREEEAARVAREKKKAQEQEKKAEKPADEKPALRVVESAIDLAARAFALSQEGKSHAQIGAALGVDKHKARRLIEAGKKAAGGSSGDSVPAPASA